MIFLEVINKIMISIIHKTSANSVNDDNDMRLTARAREIAQSNNGSNHLVLTPGLNALTASILPPH